MSKRKIGTCVSCGKLRNIYARHHCQTCYVRLELSHVKVVCADCGKNKAHQANGLCFNCYQKQYLARKWREDPVFRKKQLDYIKKYNKEHAEEIRAYARKYQREHPYARKLQAKKFGYLCKCGSIITTVITKNTSKRTRKIKCPQCGNRDGLKPCFYNRYTREILEMIKE